VLYILYAETDLIQSVWPALLTQTLPPPLKWWW